MVSQRGSGGLVRTCDGVGFLGEFGGSVGIGVDDGNVADGLHGNAHGETREVECLEQNQQKAGPMVLAVVE